MTRGAVTSTNFAIASRSAPSGAADPVRPSNLIRTMLTKVTARRVGVVAQIGVLLITSQGAGASAPRNPGAAGSTSAYASSQLGGLTITTAILFDATGVRFLAGWSSPAASCDATRRVVLDATLNYSSPSRASSPRVLHWHRVSQVANCQENATTFGVDLAAHRARASCANGSWSAGRYILSSTAIVTAPSGVAPDTTLRATAELKVAPTRPCA